MYLQEYRGGCLIKKAVFSEKLWYYIKVHADESVQEYLKLDNMLIMFCREDNACVRK